MSAPAPRSPSTGSPSRQLSAEQLLESLEQLPGVYWVTDVALRFTAVGGAGLIDQGRDPDQLIGLHVGDLPEVSAAMVETHRLAAEAGQEGSYEIRYGERDLIVRVRPLLDPAGSVIGVVGSGTDVTDRVHAEAELRARQRELATLTEHAPDIIVRFDRELRHLFINHAVEVSTGFPPEHYLGKTNRELGMPEQLCQLWEKELNVVFESGEPHSFSFEWTGPIGTRWFEANAVPELAADGTVETVLSVTRDSTEAHRAELERAVSERWYRSLFERALDMIFVFDRDGTVTDVNPAVERVLGYSRSELIGQHFSLIIPAGEVPQASERWRRKLAGIDRATVYESMLRLKDDSQIVAELSTQTVPGSDGPAAIIAVARDVTEERAARRALEASERRFRGAFDDAAVGMVLTDPVGRILRVNPVFAEMLRYAPKELEGRTIEEVTHPEDRQEIKADIQLMIEGRKDRRIADKRYVRSDGSLVYVHVGVSPVRDADGAVSMFIAQAEDVSELRRVQAELADSERLRRALVENSRDLLMVLDLDGTVRLASHSTEGILGYRPDQVVGRSLRELIHPDDYDGLWERLLATAAGAAPGTAVTRVRTTDGRFLPLEGLLAATRSDDGAPAFFVVSARDVSERIQLEEQLQRAQKLEAVGRLAGGIAHDFNNLLLAIRGNGELALRNLEHERPGAEQVREILEAADRASNLTRQLLAFSRRQVLHPDVLDLRDVVADMVTLLRRLIGENIELTTTWPDEPVWVEADQSQLEQVVANLAVNAREAMPAGGQLRFEIERSEQQALLRVSDTGVGMDTETASRVFEPFFTSKDEGTGLGLATVHGIVTQSGGEITFTTVPGIGTTFEITLPLTNRSPSAPPTAPPQRAKTGTETILLVEDEPAVRNVVTAMLESFGYTVIAASGGDQAVAACEQRDGNIDLLLTDMMMRGLDGHTTAAHLRELQPQLPVLYMSGYTGDSVFRPDELPPLTAFLQKPFSADELALAVRQLLDGD
jgi:two-component system cell cycle sensor histidine kinase/response regulator CckA